MNLSRIYEVMLDVRILSKSAAFRTCPKLLFIIPIFVFSPFVSSEVVVAPPKAKTKISKDAKQDAQKKAHSKVKPVAVLALVTYFDEEKGEAYNWWAETDSKIFPRMSRIMSAWLEKQVPHYRFVNPYKKKISIPKSFRKTSLTKTQMVEMGKQYGADIIIRGDLRFKESPILEGGVRVKANLKAYHRFNGRKLGEVLRISDVSVAQIERISLRSDNVLTSIFSELGEDMSKGQSQGLGKHVTLVVSGALTHQELKLITDHIKVSLSGVNTIRPESFNSGFAQFHVSYEPKGQSLVEDLKIFRSPNFMTQVVKAEAGHIQLDVKPY